MVVVHKKYQPQCEPFSGDGTVGYDPMDVAGIAHQYAHAIVVSCRPAALFLRSKDHAATKSIQLERSAAFKPFTAMACSLTFFANNNLQLGHAVFVPVM